jgi:gliding motility-associated protein GldL
MSFTRSKFFRNFLSKAYGIGASIVIAGALFKINNYPYASEVLAIGMITEVIVFFLSAFEPLHKEYEWDKVYPELQGGESTGVDRKVQFSSDPVSAQLDKVLQDANIGPELIQSLGKGIQNLSDNASKLADLSNAAVATNNFTQSIDSASKSALELGASYKNATEYLKQDMSISKEYEDSMRGAVASIKELSQTYKEVANSAKQNLEASSSLNNSFKVITDHSGKLGESYAKNVEMLTKAVGSIEGSAAVGIKFSEQLQKTASSLEALNSAYELQLKTSDDQTISSQKLKEAATALAQNLDQSLSNTQQYKDEVGKLNANLKALNSVYGNMLSAMGGSR